MGGGGDFVTGGGEPPSLLEASPRPHHRRWISSGGTNSTPIAIAIPGASPRSSVSSDGETEEPSGHAQAVRFPPSSSPSSSPTPTPTPPPPSSSLASPSASNPSQPNQAAPTPPPPHPSHPSHPSYRAKSVIARSVPRALMVTIPPVAQHPAHQEPLSAIVASKQGLLTLCYSGAVKFWERDPPKGAQLE